MLATKVVLEAVIGLETCAVARASQALTANPCCHYGMHVSTATDEDLSRVTIISSSRRVDLALPGSVSLSELLPSILKFSGQEANSPAEAVHAWVLQRFGSDPFDLYTPVEKLGIRDGETLYLRQRENALPDAAFDDVVDAVAGATNSRPRWAPQHSRRMGLILMCVLLIGVPLLAIGSMAASAGRMPMIAILGATTVISIACIIGAVALARAVGERVTSVCLGWCGVVLAGLVGWFLPNTFTQGVIPGAIRILVCTAMLLVASSAVALAARLHAMPMLAVATASVTILIAASVAAVAETRNVEVAAITMALMTLATAPLPTWSYRIAGIALPVLPLDAEAMLADETQVQSDIVQRAVLADRLLGAFLAATAAVAALCTWVVIQQGTIWAVLLIVCIGLAFLLRARAFVGMTQRCALLLGGIAMVIPATLAVVVPLLRSIEGALIVLGVVVIVGYIFAHWSTSTYNKVISPTWGRWGDIIEWLAIMGIVPALLGILRLYAYFGDMFR